MNNAWKFLNKIIYTFLHFVFKLFRKEMSQEAFFAFMQFVKFGIVGFSNTVVSYVIYAGLLFIFKNAGIFVHSDYLISQAAAFVISVAWSFYWNDKLVFKDDGTKKRSKLKSLAKTYVSYSFTGLFLNSILLVLWIKAFSISEFIAPLINLVITVPLNFVINKFWAFK